MCSYNYLQYVIGSSVTEQVIEYLNSGSWCNERYISQCSQRKVI